MGFMIRIHFAPQGRFLSQGQKNLIKGMIFMYIKYNIVERGNPAKPECGTKFYPSIQSTGRVSLRDLAEEVSEMSSLTTADMMAAIESLLLIIPRELVKGNVVELGDFGNFWLHSTSTGAERADQVKSDQIKRLSPRFNAGKQFKRVLRSAKFKKKSGRAGKNKGES